MAIAAVGLLAILLSSFTYITAEPPDIICSSPSKKYVRHPLDCSRSFQCNTKPVVELPRCTLGERFSLKNSTCVTVSDPKNDCKGFCVYNDNQYFIGETFNGTSECETCICSDNRGTVTCSYICNNTIKCEKNDRLYSVGMYFMELDGCNTCKCNQNVGIVCTKFLCTAGKALCFFGKHFYTTGDSFVHPDGQRNCVCRLDGTTYCTFRNIKPEKSIPETCQYNGNEYKIGNIFPADDACNMCECLSKGKHICSKWNCPKKMFFKETPTNKLNTSCTYNGKQYKLTEIFLSTDGCSKCSCLVSAEVLCEKKNCSKLISIGKVHTASGKRFCTYNGHKYKVAEVFLGIDGCSKCSCPVYGEVKCVKKLCSKLISVVHKTLPKKFCTYNGHEYRVAEVFLGKDGCSKCSCPVFGEVTCMKQNCIKESTAKNSSKSSSGCDYNGKIYTFEQIFVAVDKCNRCTCKAEGVIVCTKNICPTTQIEEIETTPSAKITCNYNGQKYDVKVEFKGTDGCSKCSCSESGVVTCLKQICSESRDGEDVAIQKKTPTVCRYNGQIYIYGQTFTALDNCNQCGCKDNGNIVCTKTICPTTTTPATTTKKGDNSAVCRYNGKIYVFGQIFISVDKCNQCSCSAKGKVKCTQKYCSSQREAYLSETKKKKVDVFAICHYNGHIYIFGQMFTAIDKCNQCRCESKGIITCSKKACPPPNIPGRTTEAVDISIKCHYNGNIYIFGQTFSAADKCNQCSCKTKGKIVCTKEKCQETTTEQSSVSSLGVCHYNGQVYIFGQIFVAVDKCNRCRCKDQGVVICTKIICASSQKEVTCHYNGEIYNVGQKFTAADKCNQCTCKSEGSVDCTTRTCASIKQISVSVKCFYGDKTYVIGATFVSIDKCNQCTCKPSGSVECTKKICVSSVSVGDTKKILSIKCHYDGEVYKVGQQFTAADECNQCTCKPKGNVDCTTKICVSSRSQVSISVKCYYGDKTYIIGSTFVAMDKCNRCICKPKGSVECTKKICVFSGNEDSVDMLKHCVYEGVVHVIGETFVSADKCNKCSCKPTGGVVCTKKICLESGSQEYAVPTVQNIKMSVLCHYNGKIYVFGSTFIAIDKCNQCACMTKGSVVCTKKFCSPPKVSAVSVIAVECHYNGKIYVIGTTFMSKDKCNKCTCKSRETVVCTKRLCPVSNREAFLSVKTTPKIDIIMKCHYNGKTYVFGDVFSSADNCNSCSCKDKGSVQCTKRSCPTTGYKVTTTTQNIDILLKCYYNGKTYVFGEVFSTADKCNTCSCKTKGSVSCTTKPCPTSGYKDSTLSTAHKSENHEVCHYNGNVYVFGETFVAIDKCNQCACVIKGSVVCTKKTCLPSEFKVFTMECHYNGEIYVVGQTFIAIDECNKCTCKSRETVVCTEKTCPPSNKQAFLSVKSTPKIEIVMKCNYNGKTYVFGEVFSTTDKCNMCSCKTKGSISCTKKPCALKGYKETTTQKDDISAVCRYREKSYKSEETFLAEDKCNHCTCKSKGNVVCTRKSCPGASDPGTKNNSAKCTYHGKVYIIGQAFIAVDKCNRCSCKNNGKLECTEKKCPSSTTPGTQNNSAKCHYHGEVYLIGQIFEAEDKCNQCSCKKNGKSECTKKKCPSSTTLAYLSGSTTQKKESSEVCRYNGKVYIFGQIFIAIDKCNKCSCKPKGKVECTQQKKCSPSTTPETSIQMSGIFVGCRYDGKLYLFGQVFLAIDKCNKCSCKRQGKVECTVKKCPSSTPSAYLSETTIRRNVSSFICRYNGKIYVFRQIFLAVDKCNKCSCKSDGKVDCTQNKCPPESQPAYLSERTNQKTQSSVVCRYDGQIYVFGQIFIAVDKCNKCSCKPKGKVVCTQEKCPPSSTPETTAQKNASAVVCRYHGKIYIFGQIFIAVDNCNKCSCKPKGKVECTQKKCPPSSTPDTTSSKCIYDGKIYICGQIFMHADKCNQCSCKPKGKVECTQKKCPPTTTPETTTQKNETSVICRYNGQIYIFRQMFLAIDKCNKCSCKSNGKIACTQKKCPPTEATTNNKASGKCLYNGKKYLFGQIFIAVDKCNQCSCKPRGRVECTEMKCPPSTTPEATKQKNKTSVTCSYNGHVYIFGQIFTAIDKCNKCSCKSKGRVQCTENKCPPLTTPETTTHKGDTSVKCHYHGQLYTFGQLFIAVDKCNQCSCKSKGKVECTEKKCPSTGTPEPATRKKEVYVVCRYHGNKYIIGQTFTAADKCNKCSCKSKGIIQCTERKCSPEKSQVLLSDITTQKIDIFIECHYNGQIFKFGKTFAATDKCNQCTCKTKGNVTCTTKTCSPEKSEVTTNKIDIFIDCHYNGRIFKFGQTFLAVDRCNKCSCMTKGSITCSRKKCPSSDVKETTTQKIDIYVVCRYNGQIFKFGQTFVAVDNCNKCICKPKGDIVCTKKKCPSPKTPAPHVIIPPVPFKLHTSGVSCVYEGFIYTLHATFLARDGCNQCSCMYNSKVLCTKKSCSVFSGFIGGDSSSLSTTKPKCVYHGKIYRVTEIFIAIDQCNSCECIFPGRVICTHSSCEETSGENERARASRINKYPIINLNMKCYYHGKMYKISETFISIDHCSTCKCIFPGRVFCGQRICEQTIVSGTLPKPPSQLTAICEYNGLTYKAGVSFISVGGCNKCQCSVLGKITCLESLCPQNVIESPTDGKGECKFEGSSYKVGAVFVSKDGCNTCKCTLDVTIMCNENVCLYKFGNIATTTVSLPVVTSVVYCKHDGSFYRFGRIFHAGDGCNLCGCSLLGKVICTKKSCIAKSKISLMVMCKYENACYSVDSVFLTIDGCSSCRCQKNGKVRCNKICGKKKSKKSNLVKCTFERKVYYAGARFLSKEGCKTCFCLNSGSVYCTSGSCKVKPKKKLMCSVQTKKSSSWYALEANKNSKQQGY